MLYCSIKTTQLLVSVSSTMVLTEQLNHFYSVSDLKIFFSFFLVSHEGEDGFVKI